MFAKVIQDAVISNRSAILSEGAKDPALTADIALPATRRPGCASPTGHESTIGTSRDGYRTQTAQGIRTAALSSLPNGTGGTELRNQAGADTFHRNLGSGRSSCASPHLQLENVTPRRPTANRSQRERSIMRRAGCRSPKFRDAGTVRAEVLSAHGKTGSQQNPRFRMQA